MTLTPERLREVVSYNSETGEFRWLQNSSPYAKRHPYSAGDVAGARHSNGYLAFWVDRKKYLAHRVAFFWVHGRWPSADLDHVNRDRTDNRIVNLREASRVQNNGNSGIPNHNTSGIKGVRWHAARGKWVAQISINNRCKYLGIYADKEDARVAYEKAAREYFGEFAARAA
ncbi:MAG: HNH endonuclease [Hyphomicrobiaceae bacterium]|nr:HNH endonuclease [Hyphomicrobiaceae bacterium]